MSNSTPSILEETTVSVSTPGPAVYVPSIECTNDVSVASQWPVLTPTPVLTEEHVLCFPRTALTEAGDFEGASLDVEHYMQMATQANLVYLPRSAAEVDETYKQLIPYVILRTADNRMFRYRRGSGGGEARLHGQYSIGVGGHISTTDQVNMTTLNYQTALERELREELGELTTILDNQAVAVINEDLNAVGRVHFGVVHIATIANPEQVVAEFDAIKDGEFVSMSELMKDISQYEGWSRICLSHLHELLHRHKKACLRDWLCREALLEAALGSGYDVHAVIAHEVLGRLGGFSWEEFMTLLRAPGLPKAGIVREMKNTCKEITTRLPMRISVEDLVAHAHLAEDVAAEILERYFEKFPHLQA